VFVIVYGIVFVSLPFLVSPSGDRLFRSALLRVLLLCCTVGLVVGAAIYLDKRPLQGYGLELDRRWMSDLLAGFVIGGAIPTVAVSLGVAGGWITFSGTGYSLTASYLRDVGLAIVIIMGISVVEELVFRGYVLTNALEGLDLRWVSETTTIVGAWGVSALLFAFTHPAPTLVDGLHFLSAGLLLGFAYLVSGQLGLPIGLHAGFNFVSGYAFPIASDPPVSIIVLSVSGPAWLTGQTGLIQTGLQLPAALVMMGWVWFHMGHLGISPTIKSKLQ
jgi:membrane protease YdiL (CAAX protease family)